MKPFDRVMTLTAGALGLIVFVLTVQNATAGKAWELPIGIAALIAGLVTLVAASFVAYRGRTR
jgi:hypothetical protein